MGLNTRDKKRYVSILSSDATIREKVEPGTPGSVKREWESKDGTKGTKDEMVYDTISGTIKGLEIRDGKFGAEIRITLDDGGESFLLTLALDSGFGTDFMRRLPNINLLDEVTLNPYSFVPDGGTKVKKGLSVVQGKDEEGNDLKVADFFYNGKKNINGMPAGPTKAEREKMDKDDWKVYFIGITKFLRKYTEDHMPVFPGEDTLPNAEEDGVQVDDLPFDEEEAKE